ncbi:ABC-2 transporter permease [Keratinibaculum paraultunense]|nr:ABC-2 transporter permease [Keratinibaculum paraultunense]
MLISIITNYLNFYPVGYLNGTILSITSIFISMWFGINLSLYYKIGYKKMKVIGNLFIFLSPFLLPVVTQKLSHSSLVSKIDSFKNLSFLFIGMALIIYLGSCIYSLKVFERRDL